MLDFDSPVTELELFQKHQVERLKVNKIAILNSSEVFKVGQSFGVCTFFGITDLHNENFMIGNDQAGGFIASPVDIEICFEDIEALSETHLVSSSTVKKNITSIFDRMSISDEYSSNLIDGFLHAWQELGSKAHEIQQLLELINLNNIPIRLVTTPTSDYSDYLKGKRTLDGFVEEEITQLVRKDIPYFWTSLNSSSVFYFHSKNEHKNVANQNIRGLLNNGHRFNLDHIKNDRSNLKKFSIIQIARALDLGKDAHISTSNHIHTIYFKDYIYIKTGNKGVKCKRLTNSFLSSPSVYYPLAQFKQGSK